MKGSIFKLVICSLLLSTSLAGLPGCKDKESYMREITGKGIAYSADSFLNEAGAGNKDRVDLFLKAGMDVNARGHDGSTGLMLAASGDYLETVRLLIDKGADVNAKNYDGYTALMFVSTKGDLEMAQLLIKSGADVNALNIAGESALMIAALNGKLEMARLLIEEGADVNARSNRGETALKYAFLDSRMSELLRKAGAQE
jgi:ankyrin repeat protein